MKFGRFLVCVFRPIVRLLFPYTIVGKENIPAEGDGKGAVLCCNHISLVDPAIMLVGQRRHIYFMAKEELFKHRLPAWFFGKQLGVFSVARGKADMSAITQAETLVNEGKIMGIFPEGTRSKTGELGRIKSGAAMILAATEGTLLPACVVTKNQKVRLFRHITLVFGKPIPFEELRAECGETVNLRIITRRIQSELTALLEEYGYES